MNVGASALTAVLAVAVLVACLSASANADSPPIEETLLGIRLGDTVEALERGYSGLYRHRLLFGEYLYEACDQKALITFTFVEPAWSPGHITPVIFQRATDVSVCRDETGALPDLGMKPVTPRGLRIGDPEVNVQALYGVLTLTKKTPRGEVI
jgi:hypothetical protein